MSADEHLSDPQFGDFYHHTTPENAASIVREGSMRGIRGELWTSNVPHGRYGGDYGEAAVHLRMPLELMRRDTGFHGSAEEFWKGRAADVRPEHIQGIV